MRRKYAIEANTQSHATAHGFCAVAASLGAKGVKINHFLPYDPDLLDSTSRKYKLMQNLDAQSCKIVMLAIKESLIPPHIDAAFREDKTLWEIIVAKGKLN